MTDIIITDLTRFNNNDQVCTAGTDMSTGKCIRPMPYLKMSKCVELGVLPGAILRGTFTPKKALHGPHQEDADYSNLRFIGPCTTAEFEQALCAGLHASVSAGFELDLKPDQKHVPPDHKVSRSIITLKVDPTSIDIVEDGYKPGKIRVHFTDSSGRRFRFLSLTDLGFFRYAETHRVTEALDKLNGFIKRQPSAYLRVGLGRPHPSKGIVGCWMQVNGIYTFPDFFKDIRSYK